MRLCRFNDDRLGLVKGDRVLDVTDALKGLEPHRWPYPTGDAVISAFVAIRERIEILADLAVGFPLSEVALRAPIGNPTKVCAAPVNYKKHLDEAIEDPDTFSREHVRQIRETGLFLKAVSAIVGPFEGIKLRKLDRRNDHEIELAAVIGRKADRVSRENALDYIAGYTIGLDMTVRGPEERSLRKSIDSYCVLGPWMVTADEIPDPSKLHLQTRLNGNLMQESGLDMLIHSVPDLIAYISDFTPLAPGDIISTGTPEGIGAKRNPPVWMKPGDTLEVEVSNVGTLRGHVEDEP